jgi:hypothetical protein
VNNSQIKILSVFPNPTIDVAHLRFASSLPNSMLYLISSEGYIICDFDISNMSEFTYYSSSLKSGSYMFIIVSDGFYSESKTMIKQ